MGTGRTDEFRKDAVRIALSSKDQKMIRGSFSLRTVLRATRCRRSGCRHVDAEQVDYGAPRHGCGVARGSRACAAE